MTDQATAASHTDQDIGSISDVITRIANQEETDKAVCAVSLLNVFIVAVNKIGNRNSFTTEDFMAFGTALTALDTVRPRNAIDYASGRARAEAVGEAAIRTVR